MKKRRIVKLLVVLCLVLALIPVTAFAAETGWVDNADGTKSYVQENGELVKNCVIEIDDKWYSFDYNGIMLTDKEFYDGNYYQSKADGTLYENEWYQPYPSHEPNRWYYYGADRKRVRNAVVNIMNADTGKEEAWSFDSIGYATKLEEGWFQSNINIGTFFYVKDGALLQNTIAEIEGKYYAFSIDGKNYRNQEINYVDENDSSLNGYYRAKADGSLYVNEWFEASTYYRYYYGEGGKAQTGLMVASDTAYYYFKNDGRLTCGEDVSILNSETGVEEPWLFGADGLGMKLAEGWNEFLNGKQVYVDDGEVCRGAVRTIDGVRYLFGWDFHLLEKGQIISISDRETQLSGCYRAKEGGVAYVNEWYTEYDEEGNEIKYYYGEGGIATYGPKTVDGTLYFFWASGQMAANDIMREETDEGDVYYYCDESGKATLLENNQWLEFNGRLKYYTQDGQTLKQGMHTIDGKNYLFDNDGYLAQENQVVAINVYGMYYRYRAKADGTPYENAWYAEYDEEGNATWYYYGEGGMPPSGIVAIDGIVYSFESYNGRMRTDFLATDEKYDADSRKYIYTSYYFGPDGVGEVLPDHSWTLLNNGKWVYVKNGELLRDCAVTIDGVLYLFGDDRYLLEKNQMQQLVDYETQRQGYYCSQGGGVAYINAWVQPYKDDADATDYERSRWYYFGDNGEAVNGAVEIDGKYYYFNYYGEMMTNVHFSVVDPNATGKNTTDYYSDENGVAIKLNTSDWTLLPNGEWVYMWASTTCKDKIYLIDGTRYGFDKNSYMYNDEPFCYKDNFYRAKAGGALYENAWHAEYDEAGNATWYYYGESGHAAEGLTQLGGVQYYFESDGKMVTNTVITNENTGEKYYCDANGIVTKLNANGWTQISDGKWIYVKDGALHTGWLDLDGTKYYMDEKGVMQTGIITIDGVRHSFADGGAWLGEVAMQTGWVQENGCWYYYDANGNLTTGWLNLNGTWYYMDANGVMQTGWLNLNGTWYYLNEGGDMATGWLQLGSTWYYLHEGGNMATGWLQLGSTWYYLNEGGDMATGWLLLGNTWYYLNEGGAMVTGEQCLGGNWYAFDSSGAWIQ